MLFESLENRQFLSATLDAAGLLIVTGTDAKDAITVAKAPDGKLVVTERTVSAAGRMTVKRTAFKFADVKAITVDAKGGNDVVTLLPGITVAATITPVIASSADGSEAAVSSALARMTPHALAVRIRAKTSARRCGGASVSRTSE